jgi:hypothetical protein
MLPLHFNAGSSSVLITLHPESVLTSFPFDTGVSDFLSVEESIYAPTASLPYKTLAKLKICESEINSHTTIHVVDALLYKQNKAKTCCMYVSSSTLL